MLQEQNNRKKKEEEEKLKIRDFLQKSGELNKLKEGLKMQLHEKGNFYKFINFTFYLGWYEDIRMYVKGKKSIFLLIFNFILFQKKIVLQTKDLLLKKYMKKHQVLVK